MTDKKRQTVIATRYFSEENLLCLVFPTLGKSLDVRVSDLSPEIVQQALVHGLRQKLADAAAIPRDPETGRSASDQQKFDAVKAVYDRITGENPSWNQTSDESGTGTGGLLYRALVRLYPNRDSGEIQIFLSGKSLKEQAALRANPKVAAIIADIRAEDAARKGDLPDTDDMLADLG